MYLDYLGGIQMKRALVCVLFIFIVVTTTCFAKTSEEARIALAQSNLPYNEVFFFKVIQQKDNYAASLFLDAGMDPNLVSANNLTPLMTAAMYNNSEAVKLLLGKENINAQWQDARGRNAADIANLFGNSDIVNIFKEKGIQTITSRDYVLSSKQINQALQTGESLVGKNDIIFTEKYKAKTPDHFFAAVQVDAKSYWLSPFCTIATEKLISQKKYENFQQDKINMLANTYQARIVFSYTIYNYQYLNNVKVVGMQNGNIIFPYSHTWLIPQPTSPGWGSKGLIANFSAHDIDSTKPIEIKVITKADKELILKFNNTNGANLEFFDAERNDYKW